MGARPRIGSTPAVSAKFHCFFISKTSDPNGIAALGGIRQALVIVMKSLGMSVAAGGIAVAVVVGVASPVSAASVACKVGMRNPVCAASFTQNPPGTLARGVRTTGSAVVKGKRVNWVCIGGNPRDCRY